MLRICMSKLNLPNWSIKDIEEFADYLKVNIDNDELYEAVVIFGRLRYQEGLGKVAQHCIEEAARVDVSKHKQGKIEDIEKARTIDEGLKKIYTKLGKKK